MAKPALPPLTFDTAELEALLLGLSYVARGPFGEDTENAARRALDRVAAALPPGATGIGPAPPPGAAPHARAVWQALRDGQSLRLRYGDKKGRATERIVWPIALSGHGPEDQLAAWCETREDFRHFRLDRIESATPTGQRVPRHRRVLLAELELSLEERGLL